MLTCADLKKKFLDRRKSAKVSSDRLFSVSLLFDLRLSELSCAELR